MTTPEPPAQPDEPDPYGTPTPSDSTPPTPPPSYGAPPSGATPPSAPPPHDAQPSDASPPSPPPAYGAPAPPPPAYGAPPPPPAYGSQPPGYGVSAYPPGGGAMQRVYPPNLSSAGKRFGAFWLEVLLTIVTLGIGWIIWDLIVWSNGQSPAKQVLHMRVLDAKTGRPQTWGQSFLRNFVCYGLIGAIPLVGFLYRIVGACFVFNDDRRALWDRMVDSVVVDENH